MSTPPVPISVRSQPGVGKPDGPSRLAGSNLLPPKGRVLGDVGNPLAINEDLPPVVEGAEIFGAGTQRWEGGRRMCSLQRRHCTISAQFQIAYITTVS